MSLFQFERRLPSWRPCLLRWRGKLVHLEGAPLLREKGWDENSARWLDPIVDPGYKSSLFLVRFRTKLQQCVHLIITIIDGVLCFKEKCICGRVIILRYFFCHWGNSFIFEFRIEEIIYLVLTQPEKEEVFRIRALVRNIKPTRKLEKERIVKDEITIMIIIIILMMMMVIIIIMMMKTIYSLYSFQLQVHIRTETFHMPFFCTSSDVWSSSSPFFQCIYHLLVVVEKSHTSLGAGLF